MLIPESKSVMAHSNVDLSVPLYMNLPVSIIIPMYKYFAASVGIVQPAVFASSTTICDVAGFLEFTYSIFAYDSISGWWSILIDSAQLLQESLSILSEFAVSKIIARPVLITSSLAGFECGKTFSNPTKWSPNV